MRVTIVAFSLLALAASAYPGSLQAKEPTRKLIVSGGGLSGGVESPPADAERVSIASKIENGQVVTVLRSPDPRQRPVTMYSADKTDFLAYKRWLFDTWGQSQLRAALASAVRHARE